jgi:hypothetical protein
MANKRQKLAGMEQRKKEPEDNTNEMKQLGGTQSNSKWITTLCEDCRKG